MDLHRTPENLAERVPVILDPQTPYNNEELLLHAAVLHSLCDTQPAGYDFVADPEFGVSDQGKVTQMLVPGDDDASYAPEIDVTTPLYDSEPSIEIRKVGKLKSLVQKLGRLSVAAKSDIANNENKGEAAAWALLTAGTQIADRARLVLIYGPPLAIDISNDTNNSLLGPIVLAGIFALTNFGTGEALTQSMDHFKETKESFREDFPLTVELFADSLAGVRSEEIAPEPIMEAEVTLDQEESLRKPWFKRIKLPQLPLPVRRGMAGVGLGSTAFVATSSMLGNDNKEVRKINAKVTRDTSGFIVLVGAGLLEGIKRMYTAGWESQAKFLSDHAQDGKTWLGVAGASIGYTFISNKVNKRKLQKQHEAEQEAQIDTP